MLAVVCNSYGSPDVMHMREVPVPVPQRGQVLIRVMAATVTAGDCTVRRMDFPMVFRIPLRLILGIRKPRPGILGQEFSGIIERVGDQSRFKPGQTVFGPTTVRMGAYAQYICVPEDYLASFDSEKLSFEHAATIPTGGINAMHFINKAGITPNETVLINGAGGSIGMYALQIAKAKGAIVTCVDSADKLPALTGLGADYVINYRSENFVSRSERYDVIIDVIGQSSFFGCMKILKPGGRLVLGNPRIKDILLCNISNLLASKKAYCAPAHYRRTFLEEMRNSLESKKLTAVIDKIFPLEELVNAHRYVEAGSKIGNVIITLSQKNLL